MLQRNLKSFRKHHAQGSDVSLETKIKESKINLTSREKIIQVKFKQLWILYSTNEVIIMLLPQQGFRQEGEIPTEALW